MPTAGNRNYSDLSFYGRGIFGYYWSSTPYNSYNAYNFRFSSSNITPQDDNYRSYGRSVRCLMNNPATLTLNLNG